MTNEISPASGKMLHGLKARVAEIKGELAGWIECETASSDHGAVGIALLELAIDRQIDLLGEADALGLIHTAFQRIADRRRDADAKGRSRVFQS